MFDIISNAYIGDKKDTGIELLNLKFGSEKYFIAKIRVIKIGLLTKTCYDKDFRNA